MICIWTLSDNFFYLFLAQSTPSTEIDSGISQGVRNSNKISMSKNIFSDNKIETTITAEKTSLKRNVVDVWTDFGYSKQQSCDFGSSKGNMLENSMI